MATIGRCTSEAGGLPGAGRAGSGSPLIDDATGGARQNRGSPHTVARGARGVDDGVEPGIILEFE